MTTRVLKQPKKNKTTQKKLLKSFKKNYALWLFVLPGIVLTFIFSYVPLYGVQIAFRNFNPKLGFFSSQWVGLKHFIRFFDSPYFFMTIKNTFVLSFYSLVAGFPIPILLALLLNSFRHKRYRKVIQTVTYAPNFISTVVMCGMLLLFLSPRVGVINSVITFFGGEAINFMGEKSLWRHIYVWSGVWQGMGWSSVIYFAALSSVSPELHEAARMDGASKFQMVRYIDFPSIIPTATILLILSCGSILSVGFEKVFLLQNDLNLSVSQVISTYVYKVGLIDNNISYSSAIGLFNSGVNALLLIAVNRISKKLSGISLW
ncbi:sugar ABC transporter permease [Vallitalea pronyensis]|uniref:Sugar ABC transporter permease n=1 Tax=Vallitalea pronyensis TaxID=1348613 RepID=A0A8J8SGE3_9FIRM|nr:ABC transporter permease subunit [Vallitalea pronyensis]QUI22304.1 sugar ABC transporter permease [Vallitalea pronyensis]